MLISVLVNCAFLQTFLRRLFVAPKQANGDAGGAPGGQRTHHSADPKGNTTFVQMAVLIDCRAAIDELMAAASCNGVLSHPPESSGEFSFWQNSRSAADDFTGLR